MIITKSIGIFWVPCFTIMIQEACLYLSENPKEGTIYEDSHTVWCNVLEKKTILENKQLLIYHIQLRVFEVTILLSFQKNQNKDFYSRL